MYTLEVSVGVDSTRLALRDVQYNPKIEQIQAGEAGIPQSPSSEFIPAWLMDDVGIGMPADTCRAECSLAVP